MQGKANNDVIGLAVGLVLTGCAAPPQIISTDTNLLRVGVKPDGYPRTFVKEEGGTCVQVTEEWRSSGATIWVKDSREITITCPGEGT